jgi:PKD repeat protein
MRKVYQFFLVAVLWAMILPAFAQEGRGRHTDRKGGNTVSSSSSSFVSSSHTVLTAKTARNTSSRIAASFENYYITTDAEPWGSPSNVDAMDGVFGDIWTKVAFSGVDVPAVFSSSTKFVFLEGSDQSADELSSFLQTHRTSVEAWVNAGGRLLLNAAPNTGGNINFGFNGTTLNYNSAQDLVQVVGPLVTSPYELSVSEYTGSSFSHAHITGNDLSPLIVGQEKIVLASKKVGTGFVVFGGMTTANYHEPEPDGQYLRANIVFYTATHSTEPAAPDAQFLANRTNTLVDREVTLVDVSGNYPTSRTWTITPSTFQYTRGTGAASPNAVVKFTAPGTYTITLTVSNALGQSTRTRTDYVTVKLPGNFYWVGGSGYWSDYENHWATSSGGSTFHDNIPSEDDNVFFDVNSFTQANEVVDLDGNDVYALNLSFAGVLHQPELVNGDIDVHGSLIASSPVKMNIDDLGMVGVGANVIDITHAEFSADGGMWIESTGTYDLKGDFEAGYLDVYGGTLRTNNYTVRVDDFYADEDGYPVNIDFGTSALYIHDDFECYVAEESVMVTKFKVFLGDDSGIYSTSIEAENVAFQEVTLRGYVNLYSSNSYTKLFILPGTSLQMNSYIVRCIDLYPKGTTENPVIISNGTFMKETGHVVGTFVQLTNVKGLGEADFFADKNSVDNGGNEGWIFTMKEGQLITLADVAPRVIGDAPVTVAATATSTLPVSINVQGPAVLNGTTITFTGPGPVTITVTQAGNATFLPADDAVLTFCVNPAKPTIAAEGLDTETPVLTSSINLPSQWYKDNELITNATDKSYTASGVGSYSVVANANGCFSAPSDAFVLLITDVEETPNAQVTLYPNPVVHDLMIDVTGVTSTNDAFVYVLDSSGKCVDTLSGTGVLTIPVNEYKPGLYIIKITTGTRVITRQIIKK